MRPRAASLPFVDRSDPGKRRDNERVFVALAALGRGTEDEVRARTGLPRLDVRDQLEALAREQKVTLVGQDLWAIATRHNEPDEHWVSDLRAQFETESEAPAEGRRLLGGSALSQRPGVRTYIGARASLAAHYQSLENAEESIWVLDRPPYLGGLPLPDDHEPDNPEMRAFDRGVDVRGVYLPGFGRLTRLWYLREFARSGVPVRIGPAPVKVAIIDQRLAFIPALRSYDVPGHMAAAVVSDPVLVQVLVELFEQSWRNARPIPLALADEDDERRSELIVMLLAGSTDAAIGRALGVTERTVRRWVRDLLTLTGAETRLQLGAALTAYRESQDGVR